MERKPFVLNQFQLDEMRLFPHGRDCRCGCIQRKTPLELLGIQPNDDITWAQYRSLRQLFGTRKSTAPHPHIRHR